MHEWLDRKKAVSVVANALRRARTRLKPESTNWNILIPWSVLEKLSFQALSEVYFNGEDNIIRLDLNEYVNLEDVHS